MIALSKNAKLTPLPDAVCSFPLGKAITERFVESPLGVQSARWSHIQPPNTHSALTPHLVGATVLEPQPIRRILRDVKEEK